MTAAEGDTRLDSVLEVRDAAARIVRLRIVPWDTIIETNLGPEKFVRGAFDDTVPSDVRLRMDHQDPPTGKGTSISQPPDAGYADFRVAKTSRGDDQLTLISEGVSTGASVGFEEVPGGTTIEVINGRRVRVHRKVLLREVSTTWRPAYEAAGVVYVRSQPDPNPKFPKENPAVSDNAAPQPVAPAPAPIDFTPLAEALGKQTETIGKHIELQERSLTTLTDRLEALEERSRSNIVVPGKAEPKKPTLAAWSSVATRMMTSQPVSHKELQERALDDIVTVDNPGLVPDALRSDLLIGVINRRRPFLESTTQITAPDTGMSIVVPKLSQRSTVAVQSAEKTEIDSTPMKVIAASFDAVTIAGGADVSIQMVRRADPSFMDLLIRDLGHDYARKADAEALAALFAAGVTSGGANIDPDNLLIGEAWENSMTATDEPPDTIWLSAAGVSAFINAKDDGTNRPLYFSLSASFKVGSGPGGDVSALRPVYVPALDATGVDVMIGPSSGFAWAEDGAIRLEADNVAKAGRDIGLVGILFFIPRYPAAFTIYDLGS